jgi:hypothetical protein
VSATTLTLPPAVHDFLTSLQAGSIVAQLDDGSVTVCSDEGEADRLILASRAATSTGKRTAKSRKGQQLRAHSSGSRGDA